MESAVYSLDYDLRSRGWNVVSDYGRVQAQKQGWPSQLQTVIQFGDDHGPSILALVIDIGSMPMSGDRFRDVFNADKDELVRGLGRFRVRQLLKSGSWAPEVGHRAFFSGTHSGVRLASRLVMFDICPSETGHALAHRFLADNGRFVECGNRVAATIARIYQPRVLGSPVQVLELPSVVPAMTAPLSQVILPSYPWRS